MILFIASEVMFLSPGWAFFDASLFSGEKIQYARVAFTGGQWPPKGTEALDPWHLPLFNTLVLSPRATTVTWAHHCPAANDRDGLKKGLCDHPARHAVHQHSGLGVYACAFRLQEHDLWLELLHGDWFSGFHVIIGTIFLCVCLVPRWPASSPRNSISALNSPPGIGISLSRLAVPVLMHICVGIVGRAIEGAGG